MHTAALCIRAASCTCVVPLTDVLETMRPLPIVPLAGTASYILGMTRSRGEPSLVLDANIMVGGPGARSEVQRFVRLRTGGRPMLLAVEGVIGIRDIDFSSLEPMPRALIGYAASSVGTLDRDVVLSLDVQQLVSDVCSATVGGM